MFIDIWGFHDVQAAISSIPDWIERFGWTFYGVDVDNWLVSGHSNGGMSIRTMALVKS